jgi:hypothetical protein
MYPSGESNRSGLSEWAVAVLGATAAVVLASQVHLNLLERERLQSGYEDARQIATSLSASVKQAEEAFQKRQIYLQKVEAQEARYAAFLDGLLELSKTDPDARALVVRHKVGGNVAGVESTQPAREPVPNPGSQRSNEQAPARSKSTGR